MILFQKTQVTLAIGKVEFSYLPQILEMLTRVN